MSKNTKSPVDYLIVGLGLAGLSIVQELRKRGKSFVVYEDDSQGASKVAGGMYNPVVLKRINPVWKAIPSLDYALPFYRELELELSGHYDQPLDILRSFKSVEEQNTWLANCDRPGLEPFLLPALEANENKALNAPFGFGRVQGTGRIEVRKLLEDFRRSLAAQGHLVSARFDYADLEKIGEGYRYQGRQANKIVFCEGNGLTENPYFNWLPLAGTKGELITIDCPGLALKSIIKAGVFIMPLGGHRFKVGATFDWKDKTQQPTEDKKAELVKKLKTMVDLPFEIVAQEAGIRPTTKDRKPFLGRHPKEANMAIFNGLGTRGVMHGPYLATRLLAHLEEGKALPEEADIGRFEIDQDL